MVAATNLLVLACVVATYVHGQEPPCVNVKFGTILEYGIPLAKTEMAAGVADWQIDIPSDAACNGPPVGVSAIICDVDAAPLARFVNISTLLVHRKGNLKGYGSVQPFAYCSPQLSARPLRQYAGLSQNLWGKVPEAQPLVLRPY